MTDPKHNNPPALTPFEEAQEEITDLYSEAKNWFDGEPITDQDQADAVQKLMRLVQDAVKRADASRKDEVKPFDDGKAEVQERYNKLIGKTTKVTGLAVRAIQSCKDALAPFLAEQEKIRLEAAEKARKEAEEKERIAQKAMIKSQDTVNLEAREEAEKLLAAAKSAIKKADNIAKSKSKASGIGRAASLRTSYKPEIVDFVSAARYFWIKNKSDFEELILKLAQQEIDAGLRNIEGIKIIEKQTVA